MPTGEAFGLPGIDRSKCPDCGAPTLEGTAASLVRHAVGDQRVELERAIATFGGESEAWLCRAEGCRMFGIFSPWMWMG